MSWGQEVKNQLVLATARSASGCPGSLPNTRQRGDDRIRVLVLGSKSKHIGSGAGGPRVSLYTEPLVSRATIPTTELNSVPVGPNSR